MKSHLFLFFLLSLVLFTTAGCRRENTFDVPQTSSVWILKKGDKVGYLGGTIHLLRSTDYPLPSPFALAYDQAEKLIFELPPSLDSGDKVRHEMMRLGTYSSGDDFSKHVAPETYLRVKEWAEKRGISMDLLHPLKPWFLALTVATTEYQILGADPNYGVDHVFGERARKEGKPTGGLETEAQQIAVFARLDSEMQEAFLLQTFDDAQNIVADFEELLAAWKSGDRARAESYLFKDAAKYETLLDMFLYQRNNAWMQPMTESIEKGEKPFFMVGTAHLFGDRGLLVLFEKAGYEVIQLQP